jgi:serine/threonine protein kinase
MTVKLSINDIELEEQIGEGNFCIVNAAKLKTTSQTVAVKTYSKAQVDRMKKRGDVFMEKHALRKLTHPNIITLIDTFTDDLNAYVVMELCAAELWQLSKRWGEPERRAKFCLRDVMSALAFMHAAGVAHRDVKAENVFITFSGRAKLGDLGSSRDFSDPSLPFSITPSFKKNFEHYVGTVQMMSPEAMDNTMNDQISDLWSFGALIYQNILGLPPFHAASEYFVMLRVKAGDLLFPDDLSACGISPAAVDCVTKFCVLDREKRMSLDTAMTHAFFADVANSLPGYTSAETLLKEEAQKRPMPQDAAQALADAPTGAGEDGEIICNRIKWVRSWEWRCQMGAGSASVDHLNID